MTGRPLRAAATAIVAVALVGCATDPTATPTAPPTPTEVTVLPDPSDPQVTPPSSPPADPSTWPTTVASAAASDPAVATAVRAEAQRRGVDAAAVSVTGYAIVTWSDGSLGCPRPGMVYSQALTPGRQLVLTVGGQRASYHAGAQGDFFHCDSPQPPASLGADDPDV